MRNWRRRVVEMAMPPPPSLCSGWSASTIFFRYAGSSVVGIALSENTKIPCLAVVGHGWIIALRLVADLCSVFALSRKQKIGRQARAVCDSGKRWVALRSPILQCCWFAPNGRLTLRSSNDFQFWPQMIKGRGILYTGACQSELPKRQHIS